MIKDLGMRRLSRWALHGITSVLMREGDLTQTEDRRYDHEGALSDTAKYERRSAATRNYKRQEQMASQRTLRKRFPSPEHTSDFGSVDRFQTLASKAEREHIFVVLTTKSGEFCHRSHRKLIQGDTKDMFKSS